MKYKLIIVLGILMTSSWSCQDFLNEEPVSQINAETFYTDASSAEIGLTGIYNRFFNEYCYSMIITPILTSTDDIKQPSGAFYAFKQRGSELNATLAPLRQWGTLYETIANVNFMLDEVSKLNSEEFKPNQGRRDEILAEGHFIRAVSYYYLTVAWGDVPLITEFPQSIEDALVAKSPKEEVVAQIKEDLEIAAKDLPDMIGSYSTDQVTNQVKGRASKWAAKAYLARLALQENDWQTALNLSEEIINSGLYPFTTQWRKIFQEPMNSSESIFEQQNDYSPGFFGSGQYGWFFGFDFEWSETALNIFEKPDSIGVTQGKDVRFDLAYNPHPWAAQAQPNKYIPPRRFEDGGIEQTNFAIIRLSELLLNKAECLNEINFASNKEEVISILNMLRARAEDATWVNGWYANVPVGTTGIPPLDPNDFTTQEDLRQAIREEKRREFVFEDVIRWVDLFRWDKEYLKEITESPTDDHLYFPIPTDEIIRNPKLTQNPAYN